MELSVSGNGRPIKNIEELITSWVEDIKPIDEGNRHRLHEFTNIALEATAPCKEHLPLTRLHVYTDGSAEGGQASWAFAVIEERGDKQFKCSGTMQGKVVTKQMDESSPHLPRGNEGRQLHSRDLIAGLGDAVACGPCCPQVRLGGPGHDMV